MIVRTVHALRLVYAAALHLKRPKFPNFGQSYNIVEYIYSIDAVILVQARTNSVQ
jgi:hypothetical protein